MKEIYFITHNKHKFEEVQEKAKSFQLDIDWLNVEYEEIQADTLEEIAETSCLRIIEKEPKLKDKIFFLEDAGLFIEALNGFPGPYSSYVFRTIGNQGILDLMHKKNTRRAFFKSVVALYMNGKVTLFTGITRGQIIHQEKGTKGFGYDPIFLPDNCNETFAQMSIKNKTLYGHRGKSLQELFKALS
ncbi:MAG: XTP/dITP diphosphatase [Candidatus Heimdallarchaeaceae archaeon]